MVKLVRSSAILLLVALTALSSARAADILEHVPSGALGFIVIRNLGGTDAKIQQVMNIFSELSEAKPPAPLGFIKAATGLGPGINEAGDAMLAVLPGDGSPLEPKPILLVAVSDYAAFASSVGGDATGEISRVKIVGQEVLAAKLGDFLVLMNVEHRPTMESLLTEAPHALAEIAPLGEWLGANNASLVLLPAGVDILTAAGQAALTAQSATLDRQFSDPQMAEMLANAKRGLELYQKVLGFFNTEVSAAAVGVTIDDDANLSFAKRLIFEPGGKLASAPDVPKMERSVLAGYPDKPFVVAGGGPMPKGWVETMSSMMRSLIEQSPEVYGFQGFDEAQWQKLESSWREAMQVRSTSMVMFAGGKDDPLYSNLYGVMAVEDSAKYMAGAKKSLETWNELTAASTSDIKMTYEIKEVDIGGKPGMMMVNDVAAAAGDDNVPMVKPMLEAMFGEDGKLRFFWVPANEQTMVMAISSAENAAAAMGWASGDEMGLAKNADVSATEALLNPAAPWSLYVSPQGCVEWAQRLYATVIGAIGGGAAITIPPYPAGPPLGFSLNITGGQLHGEMVVPRQALVDLATYIKKVGQ